MVFKDCYIQIFAKQITAKVLYGNNPRKHLWLMNLKQNFTAGKLLYRGSGSRWVVRLTSRYSLFCPGMQRYANVYRFVCEFGFLFFYGNILKSSLYIPSNVSKGVVPHKKLYIPFRYILSSFVRNPNCKSVCVGILHKFMLIEFIDFLPASYYFPWFNTLPCISVYEWACGRNPLCIT